ncbi:chemotaxis protein CheC [Paraburkholderia strydomiana]|uniref:chemotaxis protein CheC n=1 Tax=Paraburkholderia strydomiana TaxID=1245417 RepID=UPI001BE76574|nr:chemotaxis protein CheC [Paraburkholderia strydomiana]MBT2795331.1 chemotaxis protein CheC [Paraburkholderia strydomiana]
MNEHTLNEEQRDALQEICNVGMGKAAAALARLLGAFVTLSVPDIRLVGVEQLRFALSAQDDAELRPVRQAFQSDISGEAIVLVGKDGQRELQERMGHDVGEPDAEVEVLCDITNLLVGACVQSVFEQLGRHICFSRPTLLPSAGKKQDALVPGGLWDVALLLEIHFALGDGGFGARMVLLLPDAAIRGMKEALDRFLEAL